MPEFLKPHLREADILRARLMPWGGARAQRDSYAAQITVGKAGRCPETPTLTIFLFDNSGSIQGGRDPIGCRFIEAQIAATTIARRCRCGECKIGAYHFDTPTSLDLAPTDLNRSTIERVTAHLELPPDGGGQSILLPALHAARSAVGAHPDHDVRLVALTDFELFDDWTSMFLTFPAALHAIVIRAAVPTPFTETDAVTVTKVDSTSRPGTVARALFQALVESRPGAAPLAPRA